VEPTEPESAISAALDAGQTQEALRLGIVTYGREVISFLAAVHGSQEHAAEVYADASADLVRTIDKFERRCSFKTWFYALARNASHRWFDDPYRKRRTSLSHAPEIADAIRTGTAEFLRTEWKDRLRKLRDDLDPEDRAVLVLRVDRNMAWADIAEVMGGDGRADSAKWRKRFERIKDKLRDEVVRAGWLDER
jgi:RNA polymerase sigma-70 factor, ECF subfamily